MIDLALFSLPFLNTNTPNIPIYQLKGNMNGHNISSKCFDLNKEYSIQIGKEKFESYLLDMTPLNKGSQKHILDSIQEYFTNYIKTNVAPLNPNFCAITIFAYNKLPIAKILIKIIREILPSAKIVLGGYIFYKHTAQDLNLDCDHYIKGDGEYPLKEIIQNKEITKIDSAVNNYMIPDYSDYAEKFDFNEAIIIGSRSCPFNCLYCDDISKKPYRFRTAEHIFNEIKHLIETYGVVEFHFCDLLINGNMIEFKKLVNLIKNYKTKISWGGNFVVHNGDLTPEEFDDCKTAGLKYVVLGIESPVEKVRESMNKNFTNDNMHKLINNFFERGIECHLNLIVGYPTETNDYFQEHINLLKRYVNYSDKMKLRISIIKMLPGSGFEAREDLYSNRTKHLDLWESKVVPNLNCIVRCSRTKILIKKSQELGFTVSNSKDTENEIKNLLQLYI